MDTISRLHDIINKESAQAHQQLFRITRLNNVLHLMYLTNKGETQGWTTPLVTQFYSAYNRVHLPELLKDGTIKAEDKAVLDDIDGSIYHHHLDQGDRDFYAHILRIRVASDDNIRNLVSDAFSELMFAYPDEDHHIVEVEVYHHNPDETELGLDDGFVNQYHVILDKESGMYILDYSKVYRNKMKEVIDQRLGVIINSLTGDVDIHTPGRG